MKLVILPVNVLFKNTILGILSEALAFTARIKLLRDIISKRIAIKIK